jgi:lipid-binding SYLF domain-containing protein
VARTRYSAFAPADECHIVGPEATAGFAQHADAARNRRGDGHLTFVLARVRVTRSGGVWGCGDQRTPGKKVPSAWNHSRRCEFHCDIGCKYGGDAVSSDPQGATAAGKAMQRRPQGSAAEKETIMSHVNSSVATDGAQPRVPAGSATRRAFALAAVGGVALTLLPRGARASVSDPQVLLDQAHAVIEDAKHDPQFGNSPELLRQARAVMVVPELVKGGFFVGGEGGDGVLVSRTAGRAWGQPAFYVIGSASFGLQIGIEVAELVLFIMSERALRAFMQNEFKIGAEAGLTVLVVGTNAQAAATANAGADIIAWAKSKGAYAGITLEGSIIKPRDEWNAAYYGRPVTASQIVNGGVSATSAGAQALRRSLQAG